MSDSYDDFVTKPVTTGRYDYTSTRGDTGYRIDVGEFPTAWLADRADAYRPVELSEATLTREEARALATAMLAALDRLEAEPESEG